MLQAVERRAGGQQAYIFVLYDAQTGAIVSQTPEEQLQPLPPGHEYPIICLPAKDVLR